MLRAFAALLETGSVTKAADKLGVSQPAVSGMLQRLREFFAGPLFIRTKHGILPTNRSLELSAQVQLIVDEITALLSAKAFAPEQADLTINIAASDYATQIVLIPFLDKLARLAPMIRLIIHPVTPNKLQGQFVQRKIDFALVTSAEADPAWHAIQLFKEDYVCAFRDNHPLIKQDTLSVDDFIHYHHAIVSYSGLPFWGITDKVLEAQGLARHISLSLNNFLAINKVLQSSDLIAVIPKRLATEIQNIAIYPLPIPVSGFTKLLVWHERSHRDLAHQWLRKQIQETLLEASHSTL
jgi:DNA-binding transcriptional LysR family regulator